MRTCFLAITFFLQALFAADSFEWRPVEPAQLALREPNLQVGADAEAIFWDVTIETEGLTATRFSTYVRLNIYTERGVREHARFEISGLGSRKTTAVVGRTLKANGTIVELAPDAIFDRDLVKTKGFKATGKSFALPQVEPGDVVEYRLNEVSDGQTNYLELPLQRDIPVWRATYRFNLFGGLNAASALRTMVFNAKPEGIGWQQVKGFREASFESLAAIKTEPYMPPVDKVRAWMLIFEPFKAHETQSEFWKRNGQQYFEATKVLAKVDGAIKKAAHDLTAGVDTPESKLAAIERFCRDTIQNPSWSSSEVSAEQRRRYRTNSNPAATLKQKLGSAAAINLLFISLAHAAGFDARIALIPDRGEWFFDQGQLTMRFLNWLAAAVKLDGAWRFYDPGTPLLPTGRLRWQGEGVPVLIADPDNGIFVTTPQTPASASGYKRRANLKLFEDGALEGTLAVEMTGHTGVEQKHQLNGLSDAERAEKWRNTLATRLGSAEITDVEFKNVTDRDKATSG